jgi:hypothetical protein
MYKFMEWRMGKEFHGEIVVMVHNNSSIIAKLFRTFTLPHLQNFLLHFNSGRGDSHQWPHTDFLDFVSHSRCLLKRFGLVFELLSPEQLIEVLESPAVKDTLMDQSVHAKRRATLIVNDNVVEKLSLSLSPSSQGNPTPGLCSQLEMMNILSSFSFSSEKFVAMLRSRLDPNSQLDRPLDAYPRPTHTSPLMYLKYLEMDDDSDLTAQPNIKPLVSRGLLTVFYEKCRYSYGRMDPRMVPLKVQEEALLRKHVSNGLVVWEYQKYSGEWGPNYDLLGDDDTGWIPEGFGYESEDFEDNLST